MKTPKERAEQLAMKAATKWIGGEYHITAKLKLSETILTTIPLVELFECVEALKETKEAIQDSVKWGYSMNNQKYDSVGIRLNNALAKLDAKGQR